jgi:fibronectin type 3 domain-containing protein
MGYCIYRGVKHKDPSPELVNSMPFPGTRCMDDVVQNDKKYYYVVRAISAKGVTSIVSNEAPASIPAHSQTNPTVSGASAPLCREPANGK